MAEYIKRELAVSAIAFETDMSLEQARKVLGNVPSIDIARCKDCKRYVSDGGALMVCEITGNPTNEDDYCSYGERKEQGK